MSYPIYLVTLERFINEYKTHVQLLKGKNVSWISTDDGIDFFISATTSNEWYCYQYKGSRDSLHSQLKEFITVNGEILGFYEEDEEEDSKFPYFEVSA